MSLFDQIVSREITRRGQVKTAREKELADPIKTRNAVAKMMRLNVPEGKKVKTSKFPTKLAAVEAAISKEDPRSKLGSSIIASYEKALKDPSYAQFRPRNILAAVTETEASKVEIPTRKFIQKQKVGTFSSFMSEPYAPMVGQEEWEAEHPPRIPHMRAEESFAWGAGTKAAIEAGKVAFKKGPAAKIGRRKAIALLAKAGPWGRLAAAGAGAIAGFRVFEEAFSRTTEQIKKTEYGKEHPVAAELIGMGVGLATGVAVPVEAMFGGMLSSRGAKSITKFQQLLKRKNTAGEAATENPAAKELLEFKKAEEAAAKASDSAVATIDKDKVATMKRLVGTLESKVRLEKERAIPLSGAVAKRGIWTPEGLEAIQRRGEVPILPAEGVIKYTPEEIARARGRIPIAIEQETPNLPMLKPDGSLSSLGSRKVVPYSYSNIKSEEGFDRILSEVSEGKKAIDVVQKVGEMEEAVTRHSKAIPSKKITVAFKKKMSDLGYDAEEVAGMNAKVAANIERFSVKKEPSALLDKALREPIPQKIKSTIDLSGKVSPRLIASKPVGSQLYLEFDNRLGSIPDVAIIKEYAKSKGFDISATKFEGRTKPEITAGGIRDTTRYRLDVFNKEGGLSSIEAAKLSKIFGDFSQYPQRFIDQKEKLYNWAKTLSPQKRSDLVESGTIPAAINRRIVKEQKTLIEGKPKYKEFAAKEAEADIKFAAESVKARSVVDLQEQLKVQFKNKDISLATQYNPDRTASIVINRVRLPEEVRSKGIGANIINEIKKYAADNKMNLEVHPNSNLIGFYEKQGFTQTRPGTWEIPYRSVSREAKTDTAFLGMGTGGLLKEDGSRALGKAEFVSRMLLSKGTLTGLAIGGALSIPDTTEAGAISSAVKLVGKIKIPSFRNTEEALTFGKTASVEEVVALKTLGERTSKEVDELSKIDLQGAMNKAVEGQFYREAIQSSEGKITSKFIAPPPQPASLLNTEAVNKTIIGSMIAAASTFTLADIFSPAEAKAANIKDLGRVLSGASAVIFKNAKPSTVKKLAEEMKKSNMITKMQVDGCYTLQEFNRPLNIIPTVADVVKKKSLFPGAEAIFSPYIQFLYYTGVRGGQELMNNAAVQWASCQTSSLINTFNGHKTLMNILNDFIPNYGSSAKRAIKVLEPVVEKYHVPMQERAFHLGMARDFKRSYEKALLQRTKKRKFKKEVDFFGESSTIARLETLYKEHDTAYKASTAMKDEYQAAWTKAMIPFASKAENSGTRIFLLAEDTADFKHAPWLKDIATWEERAAAAKIKDMMEQYSVRVIEAGEKVITTRPFMHHAWHPAMKSELERLNKGTTLMSPSMTKLHSRSAGYMPMVPDAEYSVTSYLQDINIRLEAMNFWKKGRPDGWAAYKKWLIDNPGQAPEGLIKTFTQFEKGFIPVDTSGGINKFAEKVYALEVARLLAFSGSVPFKHSLKLIADLRVFGMEGVKAMPKAAVAVTKIAIKQRGGEEWLKRHGFGLDYLDEAVETYIETGKLYRVVSDISPFRVNESMADKALNKFNEIGGTPTSIVERFDRALSVVASIRMAAKRGMTPAQATYAIFDTIIRSNFLSGQLNPSWLRNPKIRLMMIFQGTPFKIMEQRIALHGRAWKGVGETLGQLRRDVIEGEQDFKWEMIKQGFGKQKDIFGNTLLSQSIREMVLVGTGITAAKYVWDGDLSHHFYHPPFFKAQRRDIAIGASPLVNASLETYSKYMDEDYDDFVVSTFFNSWFDSTYKGIPAPIPVNFRKAIRLTENDIPDRYRDSKLRYLFGIPAYDHD